MGEMEFLACQGWPSVLKHSSDPSLMLEGEEGVLLDTSEGLANSRLHGSGPYYLDPSQMNSSWADRMAPASESQASSSGSIQVQV